jgi:OOP family OmpA-OmpF porin
MMKKIATALLLSTVVAAPAFAADSGWYAGVTLGSARISVPAVLGVSTKNSDTVYGVVGGYQFDKNWAAELEYTGAGKFATATGSGKADAFGVTAVGTLPLSDSFGLYGKLGFAQVSGKATGTGANGAALSNANRTAATYGLGVKYNATQNVDVRFGWDRFGAAANSAGVKQNYNSNVYSVAAVYKF